jgi:alpha-ketoglutarate-dependent taurine dioxygenase
VFYPPEQKLLWHNENSFNHTWPGKILFCCARPAARGGETPVVNSRQIFEMLDRRLRERFLDKGVMYVRNYGDGLGLDWQTVFRTNSKAAVEEHFRKARIEFEWKEGGRLRTRSVRPAAVKHPRSAEAVWFNQAQHWHVSCLDPLTRESIAAVFREEDYPRNCYYGDGSPIEDSVMQEILAAYQKAEVVFTWQAGDILMLDNLLTAHARQPFAGERKLLVAMGEMRSYDEVETPDNP